MHERTSGFRFSAIDAIVIALAGVAFWLWRSWFIPIVVGHFFLFCNVFRVRRSYELVWAALFILNVAAWTVADAFTVWRVLATQAPVTVAVVLLEMRSPSYHGVFCRAP